MTASQWASEAEMCASFVESATASGWTCYAETNGFDLMLVNEDGDQLVVEAKMRANFHVLCQVLPPQWERTDVPGPRWRAVLVPSATYGFRRVARACDVTVFAWGTGKHGRDSVLPQGPGIIRPRMWVPPIVPSFGAGHPSPRTMTAWRVGALRLCALLRAGTLSGAVFKEHHMEAGRWVSRGYVQSTGDTDGRFGVYEIARFENEPAGGPNFPDIGYDAERDALAAL